MPELRVAAVIFDMDGVVIDSGDVYAQHWRSWGAQHDIDYDTQIAHVHPGRPPVETIRIVAPRLDPEAEAAAFNATLDADDSTDAVAAMPGAAALLGQLPAGRWTIATSAYRPIARQWLVHCGLPVPDALVTVDDIARGKPAPDPYLRAAELLGVEPAACLVIEDAPAGIEAAKAAGSTVLALCTTHDRKDLHLADHCAAGLWAVRAGLQGEDIVVSWEAAQD
ncbi:MAG: HAD-IA family hydrolase [Chloroflexota bacterium]|jgi:sugar-phosphatase